MKRAWLSLLTLALPLSARADASALQAELQCSRATAPGRIVCELRTRALTGKLVWSDALVVSAPPFARPLRSRVVAESGLAKLALVASEPGRGTLEVAARGVVCQPGGAAEACHAHTEQVSAVIEVDANLP
jgi:hypothetical protein